jgi:hypothetical protein
MELAPLSQSIRPIWGAPPTAGILEALEPEAPFIGCSLVDVDRTCPHLLVGLDRPQATPDDA